ncbi:MAG: hypothetical protein KDA28_17600, partial [Phycisphaerales bacterium]|nr:hypothetical protein [Phycisphaerales bacterium]
RGDPNADFDGSGHCWVTDNGTGNFDLDGGPTILTTSAFDLSADANPVLSYAWWFTNDDGDDMMTVEASSDDGVTWTVLNVHTDTAGWQQAAVDLSGLTLTDTMRFRFVAADQPNNSLTEAAIDAFRLEAYGCGCAADLNGDTVLDIFDILEFLGRFGNGDLGADWNGDTILDIFDVTAYLSDFDACS